MEINDRLYRILKRRTSRDIALTADQLPRPWQFPKQADYYFIDGEMSEGVPIAQEYLKVLNMYKSDLLEKIALGAFDPPTKDAAKTFQANQREQEVDGFLVLKTWTNLRKEGLKQTVDELTKLIDRLDQNCSNVSGILIFSKC